jgi:hypothetical protein
VRVRQGKGRKDRIVPLDVGRLGIPMWERCLLTRATGVRQTTRLSQRCR